MNDKEQIMQDLTNQEPIIDNNFEQEQKKKKGVSIWKLLLILCVLAIIGGTAYFFLFALNPKALTTNGIAKMLKSLNPIVEPLKLDYNINANSFTSNNKLTFTVNGDTFKDLKDIINSSTINYNLMYDKPNKKMFIDLDTKLSDTAFDLDLYVNNKDAYMLLHDIYDKYIKTEEFNIDLFNASINKEDYEHIYKLLMTSINNNLDDSYFTKTITFDGGPSAISELNLTKEQMLNILNNIKKDMLNDSKFNEIISIYNESEELNEIKNNDLTNDDIDFDTLKIKVNQSILTDNLKNIELIITTDGKEEKLVYEKDNNKINLTLYEQNQEQIKADITINSKNFNIDFTSIDNNKFNLKGTSNNDYYTYTFTQPGTTSDDTVELSYKFKYNTSSSFAYDTSFGIKAMGMDVIIKCDGNIAPLPNDINVDTSNYVDMNDVNQDEIASKLQDKFAPLIEKVYTALGYNNQDYDM